ncbi:MAG: MurT ligase domain-containing protein [Bifidobacterium crudilactis]|jgi:UDP-N-acetylmuramyl tripeptide synthase
MSVQDQQHERANTEKPWYSPTIPLVGKGIRLLSRLTRHGGSAFPGKVIEALDPGFLARSLAQLPLGVVLVSGTNGKTTTTRMVASMLGDQGLKVFTNPTGSNFTRGVVSALLGSVNAAGKLNADIAVLELDEAYAVHFVKQVKPRFSLLLNVMRDQLDRFGEIDNTARLLSHVAESTTGTVVLNREDRRIAALAQCVPEDTSVRYFGLSEALKDAFPSDDDMHADDTSTQTPARAEHTEDDDDSAQSSEQRPTAVGSRQSSSHAIEVSAGSLLLPMGTPVADVTLVSVGKQYAQFEMDGVTRGTSVKLEGLYNLFNAAAALTVVRAVQRSSGTEHEADDDSLLSSLSGVTPAFGRGEVIDYRGVPVELVLVKNPMGFRLALQSFDPQGCDTMVVINDEFADGRDMSWLWDVDFTSLRAEGVAMVSGVRAWDMALRLEYDEVPVSGVETNPAHALDAFLAGNQDSPQRPKRIYCTYTAMLKIRSALAHLTKVADAGV